MVKSHIWCFLWENWFVGIGHNIRVDIWAVGISTKFKRLASFSSIFVVVVSTSLVLTDPCKDVATWMYCSTKHWVTVYTASFHIIRTVFQSSRFDVIITNKFLLRKTWKKWINNGNMEKCMVSMLENQMISSLISKLKEILEINEHLINPAVWRQFDRPTQFSL